MAYTMAQAEAEARAMAEAEAMAREMTETDVATAAAVRNINPELVSRLIAAVSVLAVQPSGPAVADANHYIMSLMQTPECWPCALAALQSQPAEHVIVRLRRRPRVRSSPRLVLIPRAERAADAPAGAPPAPRRGV